MDYWISRQGQTYGPYSEDVLRAWLAQGHIDGTATACPVGGDQWQSIDELFAAVTSHASTPSPERGAPTSETSSSEATFADTAAMYCSHCGKPVEADARFCAECGTPIAQGGIKQTTLVVGAEPAIASNQPPTYTLSSADPIKGQSPRAFRNSSRQSGAEAAKQPSSVDWGAVVLLGMPLLVLMVYPRPIGLLFLVIATALIVFFEVRRQDARHESSRNATSSATWVVSFVLLWIIAYPAYMFQRRKYGLKSHGFFALAVLAIFISLYAGINFVSSQPGISSGSASSISIDDPKDPTGKCTEVATNAYVTNDAANKYLAEAMRGGCLGNAKIMGEYGMEATKSCSTQTGCIFARGFALIAPSDDESVWGAGGESSRLQFAEDSAKLCTQTSFDNGKTNPGCTSLYHAICWVYIENVIGILGGKHIQMTDNLMYVLASQSLGKAIFYAKLSDSLGVNPTPTYGATGTSNSPQDNQAIQAVQALCSSLSESGTFSQGGAALLLRLQCAKL